MKQKTKVFVGMDVHKDSVMIAVLPEVVGEPTLVKRLSHDVNGHRKPDTSGHRKSDTLRSVRRRERSDRSRADLGSVAGAHHRVFPSPERSADMARAAVGWIALESSAWRRIR